MDEIIALEIRLCKTTRGPVAWSVRAKDGTYHLGVDATIPEAFAAIERALRTPGKRYHDEAVSQG